MIDVPSSSQVHKQVVRKQAEAHDVELDPLIRLHYVEVQQPDMHDPSGDLRRLEDSLEFEWRLTDLAWGAEAWVAVRLHLSPSTAGQTRDLLAASVSGPVRDDARLFEMLILEGAQAGLSWITILKKRDNYRRAFAQFDAEKVARFDAKKRARLIF